MKESRLEAGHVVISEVEHGWVGDVYVIRSTEFEGLSGEGSTKREARQAFDADVVRILDAHVLTSYDEEELRARYMTALEDSYPDE